MQYESPFNNVLVLLLCSLSALILHDLCTVCSRLAIAACCVLLQPMLDGVLENYRHWEAASKAQV